MDLILKTIAYILIWRLQLAYLLVIVMKIQFHQNVHKLGPTI